MNTKYNGGKWVVDVTGQQFQEIVERFFKQNPFPTCDELRYALVPGGIPNTAVEGKFGTDGIFKHEFVSSDGIYLMVKYHKPDEDAEANNPGCNSGNYWTTQIVCNDCSYFLWYPQKKKASTVKVSERKIREGKAPRCDAAHIPLRSGPSNATKDWTHMSKVSLAGEGDCPTLLLFLGDIFQCIKFRKNLLNDKKI